MEKQSKGRSRPMPDASKFKHITFKLEEALSSENHFIYKYSDRKPWEVTMSARSGAVHGIRFLKMWFGLPQSVFFAAISYLDMFLARLKVQEKFLSCLSVSCFNIAAINNGFNINASHLVTLSQSNCSVKDMQRMSLIITQKLNLQKNSFSSSLDLLRAYMDIFKHVAVQYRIESLLNRMLQWQQLCIRLEVLICDSSCACFKPSIIALAFIHFEMERFLSREIPRKSNYYSMEMFYILAVMIELRSVCSINPSDYAACFETITKILKDYDGRKKIRHCQKLTWRFSLSTYALAKYSHSMLHTIKEE